MIAPLKKLESEAMDLPAHERAQLAHRLLVSLDEEDREDLPAVERAWAEEIHRRMTEIDSGDAELIAADDVFSELRDRGSV
jgi:putative addiction module component (TIGR02574 family)